MYVCLYVPGTPPASCDLDKYHMVQSHVEAVPDTVEFGADLATDPLGNAEKAKRDVFDFASAPDKSKLVSWNPNEAESILVPVDPFVLFFLDPLNPREALTFHFCQCLNYF